MGVNNDEINVIARRIVGWLPGMLDTAGVRFCTVERGFMHGVDQRNFASQVRGLPDMSDAATRGCVLELGRDAWGNKGITVARIGGRWWALDGEGGLLLGGGFTDGEPWGPSFASEVEALIGILKAAPAHALNSAVCTTGNPTS